jgi:predicted RNA-binding protein with PUA domain
MIVIKTPEGLKLQTVSEADVMQVLLQKFPGLKDYDEIIVKEITYNQFSDDNMTVHNYTIFLELKYQSMKGLGTEIVENLITEIRNNKLNKLLQKKL